MELGLQGKVVIVTGASRGIGIAITRGFAAAGARVVAGSREISDELRALEAAGRVTTVKVDLALANGPAVLVTAAGGRGGGNADRPLHPS
jgi:NAD(P)-dependent dehydrogenase (short-subunit alcohol dehydrogenase family)